MGYIIGKKYIIILFLLLATFQTAFSSEFGQYRYSKYNAINQQLQTQRIRAIRRQQIYNSNPTRNIKYPTSNNPYPNIQKDYNYNINRSQRYSSSYYKKYVGN